jgi:hypothetical protein
MRFAPAGIFDASLGPAYAIELPEVTTIQSRWGEALTPSNTAPGARTVEVCGDWEKPVMGVRIIVTAIRIDATFVEITLPGAAELFILVVILLAVGVGGKQPHNTTFTCSSR